MKHLILLFIAALAFTACGDDDETNRPTAFVTDLNPIDFAVGDTVRVEYSATKSMDADLANVEILEDNSRIDASRLIIDGSIAAANPFLLFNEDQTSFTYIIDIISDFQPGETKLYSFIVTDDAGEINTQNLSVTVDTTGGGGGGDDTPPVINTGANVVDQFIQIGLDVTKGTGQLASASLYRDGDLIPAGQISFGSITWSDNPYALPANFQDGISTDLLISLHSSGEAAYLFIVTDVNGLSDSLGFTVTLEDDLDSVVTGIALLNAAGPSGTGGVNLLTGASTGSGDASAHLIDLGIDQSEPNATNWRRQIAPGAATTTLKSVDNTAYSFDDTTLKEEIIAAFDDATSITVGASGSNAVDVGDLFVLRTTDDTYILVSITAVNNTTDDNSDNYVMSIKY